MAVLANAGEEEVNAARALDPAFVIYALGFKVGGVAVEDVDVVGVYIDVLEEVLPHEAVVALWVISGDPDILVLFRS